VVTRPDLQAIERLAGRVDAARLAALARVDAARIADERGDPATGSWCTRAARRDSASTAGDTAPARRLTHQDLGGRAGTPSSTDDQSGRCPRTHPTATRTVGHDAWAGRLTRTVRGRAQPGSPAVIRWGGLTGHPAD